MNEPSPKALIEEYLSALRILDIEGPAIMSRDTITKYRRRLLKRIAELDELSRNTAPRQAPSKP